MVNMKDVIFQKDGEVTRVPHSELELNHLTIESNWGGDKINQNLVNKLTIKSRILAKAGSMVYNVDGTTRILDKDEELEIDDPLWSELGLYQLDLRFGNLTKSQEVRSNHYLLITADAIRLNLKKVFIVAYNRVIAPSELSQSRGGFLREWLSTIRKIDERKDNTGEPSLLFPKKSKGGY